jgi:hypothetical protein
MNEQIDDGGPAFPVPEINLESAGVFPAQMTGMTLRDYFAAAAMTAIPNCGDGADLDSDDFARACYQFADSMLAARKEGQP